MAAKSLMLADAPHLWSLQASRGTTVHPKSDHGQLAVTKSGYVCEVWSHQTGANKHIAYAITKIDLDNPRIRSVVAEGELAADGTSIYGGGETCEKPWVSVLSHATEQFVVTWERQATAAATTRIEAARIYKNQEGIGFLVDQATAGSIGWPLDDGVAHGDADANCRSCYVADGWFAIGYGTETANVNAAVNERTYSRRHGLVPWTTAGNPVAGMILKQYTGQHWDDADANPTIAGGYLLGHLAVTPRGDILTVWENRDYDGANFVNTIQYRILAGLYHATPFATEIETGTILSYSASAANDLLALRRPTLAGLHPELYPAIETEDGYEIMWMVCGREDVDDPENSYAKLIKLKLYGGGALQVEHVNWEVNTGPGASAARAKLGSACPFMSRLMSGGIAVADFNAGAAGRFLSVQHANGKHETRRGVTRWPDRPWIEILPLNDGSELALLSTEGFDEDSGSDDSQRYLEAWKITKEVA